MSDSYFNRQTLIQWWDQEKLYAAKVLVIGAGALGNETIKNLTLLGIGQIIVVDFDIIEDSNLSRAVFFNSKDAKNNASKATVTAERAQRLNPYPHASVKGIYADVVWEIGAGLYRRADIVLGCLDNIEARLSVNLRCWQTRKIWIDGGMWELSGSISVYDSTDKLACYECSMTNKAYEQARQRYSCTNTKKSKMRKDYTPTTQTTSAVVSAIQAQEAVKIIHQIPSFPGKRAVFNGQPHFYTDPEFAPLTMMQLTKNPQCLGHSEIRFDKVIELPKATATATTVAQLFDLANQFTNQKLSRLELGHDFVLTIQCPICNKTESILQPVFRLTDADIICKQCEITCPRCGHINKATPNCENCGQSDLIKPRFEEITELTKGEENYKKFQDYPLNLLGIPPFHIITLYDVDGYHHHFELTGDQSKYWL